MENHVNRVIFHIFMLSTLVATTRGAETPWKEGLSDKTLAMQRWFSELSFLNDRHADTWEGWCDDKEQLGLTSLRYQLAFAGYGCAAAAGETPAYRELARNQLGDLCERMIDLRVWFYVPHYWKYGDAPPDPCLFENVMYTGHLTQMMCLYEHVTGDLRYSETGWDFVWKDGRKTHYTLAKAIERMAVQSEANPSGGICCEPNLIFAVCNSHSSLSYLLHDVVHGTHYADVNEKWFTWMSRNFRNKAPLAKSFLYAVYHRKLGVFAPVGDIGADGWALGWGYPWFPDLGFAEEGWKEMVAEASWDKKHCDKCCAKTNPVMQCCGVSSLVVSNGFIPIAAVQMEGKDSPIAAQVIRWLDERCGKTTDLDGDGFAESMFYAAPRGYEAAVTGNVLAALTTDGDAMRQFYRTPRKELPSQPTLAHVDYPNVYVRAAEYQSGILRFVVLKGTPRFNGTTELVCENVSKGAKVFRDGKPFETFSREGDRLILTTDVDCQRVFEIRAASRSPAVEDKAPQEN